MASQDLLRLELRPDQDSYTFKRTNAGYIRAELDGGEGKYRRDVLGSSETVTVRFTLNADAYSYLWSLYRVFAYDMTRFRIDLILEDEGLVEVEAWFVPDTFKLTRQTATTYVVQATLEAIPPIYDIDLDRDYLYIIKDFGLDWRLWLDRLQVIVNDEWSIALGM